jgi:hypothetical protein
MSVSVTVPYIMSVSVTVPYIMSVSVTVPYIMSVSVTVHSKAKVTNLKTQSIKYKAVHAFTLLSLSRRQL